MFDFVKGGYAMFKKMKLASKLAYILGGILTIIFVALIAMTTVMTKSSISSSIAGELTVMSRSNGLQVQQVFDDAQTTAANMQSYLEKAYQLASSNAERLEVPTNPEISKLFQSTIYPKTLAPLNYDVEVYLTELARNVALNNPDIVGMGAMFEPYKFQSDIKDYAFYLDASNPNAAIEPLGEYETYSSTTYYKDTAAVKEERVTDPYEDNGMKKVAYTMPILYNNELQGIVMAEINIDNFNKLQVSNDRYPSMYTTIYDNNEMIIYDSEDLINVGKKMDEFLKNAEDMQHFRSLAALGEEFQIETTRENGSKVTRYFTPIHVGNDIWWSLTAVSTSDVNKAAQDTAFWLIVIAAVALFSLIFVTVYVLKRMLHPLKDVVRAAESISQGNLDVHLSSTVQDEIGILSDTFQKMSNNLKSMVEDIRYLLGEMAAGNFNVETKVDQMYVGDYQEILHSMNNINQSLSRTLKQINESAELVASGSDQVSAGSQALSQGATEQASSIEELAATINEISVHVSQNAESAHQASKQALATTEELENGKQKMSHMMGAMEQINNSSGEIGKIIKTIEDIAFQTNILALNAAVEAARAGAAGKGFAVVADEVRNLASKSAEASKNTSALIEATLQAVREGTDIANVTAESLDRIVKASGKSAQLAHEISKASREQASSIDQITIGVDQISSVIQTNSATAEESAAASQELSSQAQILKDLVSRFKLEEIEENSSMKTPSYVQSSSGTQFEDKYTI